MLNKQTTMHGVFLNIFQVGVLITGNPGAGKSELALALIDRGHQLVADDAPQFTCGNDKTLIGSCPELLQGFLQIREIGILNIKLMFGDKAIKKNAELRLVINLGDKSSTEDYIKIQNIRVSKISISEKIRNQVILVEAAVRNFLLKQQGYDADSDFNNKQKQLLQQETI